MSRNFQNKKKAATSIEIQGYFLLPTVAAEPSKTYTAVLDGRMAKSPKAGTVVAKMRPDANNRPRQVCFFWLSGFVLNHQCLARYHVCGYHERCVTMHAHGMILPGKGTRESITACSVLSRHIPGGVSVCPLHVRSGRPIVALGSMNDARRYSTKFDM